MEGSDGMLICRVALLRIIGVASRAPPAESALLPRLLYQVKSISEMLAAYIDRPQRLEPH